MTRTASALMLLMGLMGLQPGAAQQHQHHGGHQGHGVEGGDPSAWRMPPMNMDMPMMPGMAGRVPNVAPFLPGMSVDPSTVPEARFREVLRVQDGDTLSFEAGLVRRTIGGQELILYGFNGQYPGPLVQVEQDATVTVHFTNQIEMPSTIHWHGLRLDNRFDGVPGVTQDPVMPGETFTYTLHFPDPGLFWYHPHVREDIQQDAGLYGNILVSSPDPDYYGSAHRDEVVILDDLLVDELGLLPWGAEEASHALMGRFGNVFLTNGSPDYRLEVQRGEVVRFHLTNVSNTRTFNLSFGGNPIKLVAADLGRFEREEWVPSVVIAPAQRYVVEVLFQEPGAFAMMNRVQTVDHMMGEFLAEFDTLGVVTVAPTAVPEALDDGFRRLREVPAVQEEMAAFQRHMDSPPELELELTLRVGDLPAPVLQMMAVDTVFTPPLEWGDGMPDMNWVSTGRDVRWILRETATNRENLDIEWDFEVGDVVKLRLVNTPFSFHPMQHPIHIHGQRFMVVVQDGVAVENRVWRDTVLVPVGSTVDLLVEMSNPGAWMMHCHIAEHLSAGMEMVFNVGDRPSTADSPGHHHSH